MLNLRLKPIGTIYNINNFLKLDINFYVKVDEKRTIQIHSVTLE